MTRSTDLMPDRLGDECKFRLITVLGDFHREGLGVEVEILLPAERAIRRFDHITEWRGKQGTIRVDSVLYAARLADLAADRCRVG